MFIRDSDGSHDYYRDEQGTHCVPKLRIEDLLLG